MEEVNEYAPMPSQKQAQTLKGMMRSYLNQIHHFADGVETCYSEAVEYYPHDELTVHDDILKCCMNLEEMEYLIARAKSLTTMIHELD